MSDNCKQPDRIREGPGVRREDTEPAAGLMPEIKEYVARSMIDQILETPPSDHEEARRIAWLRERLYGQCEIPAKQIRTTDCARNLAR